MSKIITLKRIVAILVTCVMFCQCWDRVNSTHLSERFEYCELYIHGHKQDSSKIVVPCQVKLDSIDIRYDDCCYYLSDSLDNILINFMTLGRGKLRPSILLPFWPPINSTYMMDYYNRQDLVESNIYYDSLHSSKMVSAIEYGKPNHSYIKKLETCKGKLGYWIVLNYTSNNKMTIREESMEIFHKLDNSFSIAIRKKPSVWLNPDFTMYKDIIK